MKAKFIGQRIRTVCHGRYLCEGASDLYAKPQKIEAILELWAPMMKRAGRHYRSLALQTTTRRTKPVWAVSTNSGTFFHQEKKWRSNLE